MSLQSTLRKNWREITGRNLFWAYFGERPEGIAPDIAALNGESLLTLAYSATQPTPLATPSGTIALIGTDGTSGNTVVAPNGLTIPTGKVLAVTDANALTAAGVIIPSLYHGRWTGDAAQAVNRAILISRPVSQILLAINVAWGTASSSGTITVEKLTGTTAPGSGIALLTGTISTAGTANTVNAGTLIATTASLTFAQGDRLGIVVSGTETGLVGLVVEYSFQKLA